MTRAELLQTAKPILFNTDMVRAILDGRKTVTRRVLKNQDKHACAFSWEIDECGKPFVCLFCNDNGDKYLLGNWSNYGIGDILYVRETWERFDCCHCEGDSNGVCLKQPDGKEGCYMYRASDEIWGDAKWRPSIHMPKEAARIFLRVTDVWVERLQEINADGIRNEGLTSMAVHVGDMEIAQAEFALLWDTTVKKSDLDEYGWNANPWVWVIEFEKLEAQNDT